MFARRGILCLVMLLIAAASVLAVDGIAVSTQIRLLWPADPAGDIVRYDIRDNNVVAKTTLFDGKGGNAGQARSRARFPAISIDGMKVAFYRLTTDSGDFVSLMNANGTGLTNLVKLDEAAGQNGNGFLDWPAGDWVYYVPGDGAKQIRRVNVRDTRQNEAVVTFGYPLWQWQLSADATKMQIRFSGNNGAPMERAWYVLPGDGSITTANRCGYGSGCGTNISPSGAWMSYLEGGSHNWMGIIAFARASETSNDATLTSERINAHCANPSGLCTVCTWSDETPTICMGYGMDSNRWSCNADKWMTLCMGWIENGGGSGRYAFCGANQVLFNWQDSVAVNASKNPRSCESNAAATCDVSTPNAYSRNDAGDFWVSGPLADVNADLRQYVRAGDSRTVPTRMQKSLSVRRVCSGQIEIAGIGIAGAYVELFDALGNRLKSVDAAGAARLSLDVRQFSATMCFVKTTSEGGSESVCVPALR